MAKRSQNLNIKSEATRNVSAVASAVLAEASPDAGAAGVAARTNNLSLEGNTESLLAFAIPRSQAGAYAGKEGQLLQKMIMAMGVRHTSVLMINVDIHAPHALSEIKEVLGKAKILVTLGEPITQFLLMTDSKLSSLRGGLHPFDGLKVIPSFHPAELLASPGLKKEAWEDLKVAVKELGWTLPARGV